MSLRDRIPHFKRGFLAWAGAKKIAIRSATCTPAVYSACFGPSRRANSSPPPAPRGLDGLVITEHDHVLGRPPRLMNSSKPGRPPRRCSSSPPARSRVALDDQSTGDLLVYGRRRAARKRPVYRRRLPPGSTRRGGIVIAPHPFARGSRDRAARSSPRAWTPLGALQRPVYPLAQGPGAVPPKPARSWGSPARARQRRPCHRGPSASAAPSSKLPIATLADLIEAIRNHQCRPPTQNPPTVSLFKSIMRGLKKVGPLSMKAASSSLFPHRHSHWGLEKSVCLRNSRIISINAWMLFIISRRPCFCLIQVRKSYH